LNGKIHSRNYIHLIESRIRDEQKLPGPVIRAVAEVATDQVIRVRDRSSFYGELKGCVRLIS